MATRRCVKCVTALLCMITAVKIDSRTAANVAEFGSRPQHFQTRDRRPVDFIANRGQWDRRISFIARRGSMTAVVERATLALRLDGERPATVSLTFEHASPDRGVAGKNRRPTHYNFYVGNDSSTWQSDVPAYAAVAYHGLYPGIDVRLHEVGSRLEYELRLEPGADLEPFVFRVDGVSSPRIDNDGSLVLETPNGLLRQSAPTTWEELPDGRKRFLASSFRTIDSQRYGFQVAG